MLPLFTVNEMSVIDTRRSQVFPVFDGVQLGMAKGSASAPARSFRPGEIIFDVGARYVPTWLVLEGSIEVLLQDGLGREQPIAVEGAGQFSGEIRQLAGRGAIAAGRAGPQGCTALPIDAAHLRALFIGSAALGEIMMRALILRRVTPSSIEREQV
jgi:thioredoxin reductase (NADPH)